MFTSRPILTVDKLIKITIVYHKMLHICEILGEGHPHLENKKTNFA